MQFSTSLEDRFRGRLQSVGLRATRPRLLAYGVLTEAGGHRSVDDVVALLRERGHDLPRMSIYNVMSDLSAAGLIMIANVGPGRALYEASETWHHHFVCRRCGDVVDVPCVVGRKPCLEPPEDLPGSVDEAQVTFRGVCSRCSSSSNAG